MAGGTNVRATVNDSQIASLFVPGGDGWDWMRRVGTEQLYETIGTAPVRSGDLSRSFRLSLTPNGRNQVRYTVGSYSDYAVYVIFGTTGPIYANDYVDVDNLTTDYDYPHMRIRPMPHSGFSDYAFRLTVRGQTANDFMGRAAQRIIARYA